MPVTQSHSRQPSNSDSSSAKPPDSNAATESKDGGVRKFTLGGDAWNKKNAKKKPAGGSQEREAVVERDEDERWVLLLLPAEQSPTALRVADQ